MTQTNQTAQPGTPVRTTTGCQCRSCQHPEIPRCPCCGEEDPALLTVELYETFTVQGPQDARQVSLEATRVDGEDVYEVHLCHRCMAEMDGETMPVSGLLPLTAFGRMEQVPGNSWLFRPAPGEMGPSPRPVQKPALTWTTQPPQA